MHATTAHRAVLSLLATVVLVLAPALLAPTPASGEPASADPVGVWPLQPAPEVVRAFDPPGSTWGAGHRGVDLLGRVGQPVRSALDGVVSFAGVIAGRGVVVVDHGATRTTYEPVSAAVAVGTRVVAGERLGSLQPGGSHCPPRACLHWGWLRGSTYLDPLGLVGAGPVRLLPLWQDSPVAATPSAVATVATVTPYAGWRPWVRLFR